MTSAAIVVAGEQSSFQLRNDSAGEPDDAGPGVTAVAQGGKEVVAELLAERLLDVPGRSELADGGGCRRS